MKKYQLVLETSGFKYNAEGKTIEEALGNLGVKYHRIKAKGIVKISQGKYTLEHLFQMKQLRRILANKITRLVWGKRLNLLLTETAANNADRL